jgi:multidrug resistance protein MdtO
MAVVFVAAFASAWVAGGSPRISYAGFQIAFAFFLCAMQGAAPAFDMTVARDRVIGILFGNLVVFLVFTNIWPVTVTGRIDAAIASLLRKLSVMATATTRSRRCALASDASAALGTVEQDLSLAGYEPSSVRPANDWLAARWRTADEIAAMMGPLLLRANQSFCLGSEITRRLDVLATRFDGRSGGQGAAAKEVPDHSTSPGKAEAVVDSMDQQIVAALQSLEQASLAPYPDERGAANYASA